MRQYNIERKPPIQSAHTAITVPKLNSSTDKALFNANQHKYQTQTPMYQYPRPMSAVELLAKKYVSNTIPRTSTGLFWYSANQMTVS